MKKNTFDQSESCREANRPIRLVQMSEETFNNKARTFSDIFFVSKPSPVWKKIPHRVPPKVKLYNIPSVEMGGER